VSFEKSFKSANKLKSDNFQEKTPDFCLQKLKNIAIFLET